jgi:Uncharacterized conserved protein
MKNGNKRRIRMIKIIAQNYIKADKVEEFIILAKQLVLDTRENDAGCIQYDLLQDLKNPQFLTILEEWEDQEALNKHGASKHFKEAVAQFAAYTERPGDVHYYQILV